MKNKSKCNDCGWKGHSDSSRCPVCAGRLTPFKEAEIFREEVHLQKISDKDDRFDKEKLAERYSKDTDEMSQENPSKDRIETNQGNDDYKKEENIGIKYMFLLIPVVVLFLFMITSTFEGQGSYDAGYIDYGYENYDEMEYGYAEYYVWDVIFLGGDEGTMEIIDVESRGDGTFTIELLFIAYKDGISIRKGEDFRIVSDEIESEISAMRSEEGEELSEVLLMENESAHIYLDAIGNEGSDLELFFLPNETLTYTDTIKINIPLDEVNWI